MDLFWTVLAIVLMVAGLIGTVVPALPGVALIFAGVLVHAWGTGFETVSGSFVLWMLGLTVFALAADYLSGTVMARRAGASRAGMLGAFIGGVAGTLIFGPLGLVLGPLLGAFAGELIDGKAVERAAQIGWRAVVGVWIGMLLQIGLGLTMVTLWLIRVF
ncbi:MAG TPA: DUF456 family protein [Bacillota bacterium]